MLPKCYCLAFIILCSLSNVATYRILALFAMPSKSHSNLGHGVVRHLLQAGHEVTHVTAFPRKQTNENLREIAITKLKDDFEKIKEEMEELKIRNVAQNQGSTTGMTALVYYLAQKIHETMFEAKELINLLNDPKEKFDVVIAEWFFFNGISGIASVLQCPLIWFSTSEVPWNMLKLIDEIPNPAYTTDLMSVNQPPLTFLQRVSELTTIIWSQFVSSVVVMLMGKRTFNKIFLEVSEKRGVQIPSYEDAVYNGSFMLINSHPSYGQPYKLPQNAKYVGGFHIENNVKPLPQDLKNILDKAEHGVIYFSMGSNLRSADMSAEMKSSFLKMFEKLKQKVIWKFETDLDNVPRNVHLVKWAPQESILAHPNLKMFITHGGQLSTTEAIHFGVPVIGIPVAADQHINMNSVAIKGSGIKLTLAESMDAELFEAIQKIIIDPSYKQKAKELSAIYHDRSVPPGKEIVHWVEHVIRTGGALHLRSPALMVPWYQKMYLDFIALILIVLSMLFYICKKSLLLLSYFKRSTDKKMQ